MLRVDATRDEHRATRKQRRREPGEAPVEHPGRGRPHPSARVVDLSGSRVVPFTGTDNEHPAIGQAGQLTHRGDDVPRVPVAAQVPVLGSYSSAAAASPPPATRTVPSGSSVLEWLRVLLQHVCGRRPRSARGVVQLCGVVATPSSPPAPVTSTRPSAGAWRCTHSAPGSCPRSAPGPGARVVELGGVRPCRAAVTAPGHQHPAVE